MILLYCEYTQHLKVLIFIVNYQKVKFLKLKWLTLRLETSATEKALELMSVYMPYQLNALKMKYLELKQIGYIADELGFGERTIKRYIKEAEQELERLFEELA